MTGPQLLEGVTGKEGGEVPFFQGGCTFHMKNKLKSEIFNDKKGYKQKYFSLSELRIQTAKLPKNLVNSKR